MALPTPERLTAHLQPIVHASALELEEVVVHPAGRRSIVRVIVDSEDGVSLDQVAAISHDISSALDDDDLFSDMPFTLEVTSPGVDRPLTAPRHWRRNRSRLVKITTVDGDEITGRILSSDEQGAVIELKDRQREIHYATIKRAKIEVEFNRSEGSS
jgi:ribosome maturation factor RimP